MDTRFINIEKYSYDLPQDKIAQHPLSRRDQSRLLIYRQGEINGGHFFELDQFLPEGSLMIMNETRVIRARLHFRKESGALVEIFCLEPLEPVREIQQAFSQNSPVVWKCLVGNAKRWKKEKLRAQIDDDIVLFAEKTDSEEGHFTVRFTWTPTDLSFSDILEAFGKIPLPPYINREAIEKDTVTYQTVYATNEGSVAAPTAGLHFTPKILDDLDKKNIDIRKVTLHVGAGTFRPVAASSLAGHRMHTEQIYIERSVIEELMNNLHRPVILVGTTTTRLVESLYWHGAKLLTGKSEGGTLEVRQWDPYEMTGVEGISRERALEAVLQDMKVRELSYLTGTTSLMIAPGYVYRFPDIMITNFHQPKSTLLLLIAAFIGEDWRKIYQYALANGFRFLSYGDSCLLFRKR